MKLEYKIPQPIQSETNNLLGLGWAGGKFSIPSGWASCKTCLKIIKKGIEHKHPQKYKCSKCHKTRSYAGLCCKTTCKGCGGVKKINEKRCKSCSLNVPMRYELYGHMTKDEFIQRSNELLARRMK